MRRIRLTMDEQIAAIAVAARGSYEAAGKYLGVTKSAIRKRIQGVDSELGAAIFRASSNGVVLTEVGGIFLPEARESVRHAQLAIDTVRGYLRAKNNDFRIGYSSHLNERLLDIIARLETRYSDGSLYGRESLLTHQVVSRVLQGDLTVGFGYLPLDESTLSVRPLMEEPLIACLPPGHRLATKHSIAPEDLENEPIIAVARRALPGRHEDIIRHFEIQGIALNIVTDAYLPKEALWLVGRGVGVAFMTRASASSRSDLVIRPFSDQLLAVKSGIFARRTPKLRQVDEFMNLALSATEILRASTPLTRRKRSI
jgi:DNA-binding transcriptional LysR family regulator